jgi:DNA-binding transcriptional LysR family regulator
MMPTPFAEQLAEPIGYALGMIHSGLNQHSRFDPASVKRSVTIGMTDIGEIYFLPTLMDRLREAAPAVSISTVRNTAVQLKEGLEQGQADLAIGLLPQLQAGFHQRRLFSQRYVCLFRRGHALDGRRLTLRGFEAADHVVVVSAGTGHGQVDELLARSGVRRRVRLTVPHFVAVGHILQHSDMVATVPEKLAQALAEPFGLSHAPHPARLPAFDVGVFWHATVHRDPANQWLRQLIVETFAP